MGTTLPRTLLAPQELHFRCDLVVHGINHPVHRLRDLLQVVFQRGVRSAVAQLLLHVLERSLALTDRTRRIGPPQDLEIQLWQA